jgi:hypothetical protein
VRQRAAGSSLKGGSTVTSVSSCSTVHGEEVRSRGKIGWRTRGGGAHREVAAATMAARLAARSGRGMDAGANERSMMRGGMARGVPRGKGGGGDETGTEALGGAHFNRHVENRGGGRKGGSGGEDAMRCGAGVGPGPDRRTMP